MGGGEGALLLAVPCWGWQGACSAGCRVGRRCSHGGLWGCRSRFETRCFLAGRRGWEHGWQMPLSGHLRRKDAGAAM